jgi:hypothetical protein
MAAVGLTSHITGVMQVQQLIQFLSACTPVRAVLLSRMLAGYL